MKVAVVTCYSQNDYIRARTLRTAFVACPGVETIVVRNKHKGLLRYPEVMLKLAKLRFTKRPDAYVLAFRAYEMLFFTVFTLVRKPIVFDELINIVEYYQEHGRLHPGTWQYRLVQRLYGWLSRRARLILADTDGHADLSAKVSHVPRNHYRVIRLAAEESLFYPKPIAPTQPFTVFYYGHGMTPLHGLQYVLDAAVLLKDRSDIQFNLVGGKQNAADACAAAVTQGAHVVYEKWVPFDELPDRARAAGLCLGGPFGATLQSQFVVTGKTTQFLACAAPVLVGQNRVSMAFKDRKNCLLVPPANPRAIADAIIWAADHPKELKTIAAAGRMLYEQQFSQRVANGVVQGIVQELAA